MPFLGDRIERKPVPVAVKHPELVIAEKNRPLVGRNQRLYAASQLVPESAVTNHFVHHGWLTRTAQQFHTGTDLDRRIEPLTVLRHQPVAQMLFKLTVFHSFLNTCNRTTFNLA